MTTNKFTNDNIMELTADDLVANPIEFSDKMKNVLLKIYNLNFNDEKECYLGEHHFGHKNIYATKRFLESKNFKCKVCINNNLLVNW